MGRQFFRSTPGNLDDVVADLLWIFPGLSLDRIEAMTIPETMAWHERAITRKRADFQGQQAAVRELLAAMTRR